MMSDFYQVFGADADEDKQIPDEILEELNKDIPDNFMYIQNEEGECRMVPRQDQLGKPFKMTTQLDFEKDTVLKERLKEIPQNKWAEYLYRIQRAVAVKNIKIGNEKQLISLENTIGNPLSEEKSTFMDCRMIPERFPDPIPLEFEIEHGENILIFFQQQIYDNFNEIKFSNVSFPALKIDIFVYNPLLEKRNGKANTDKRNPVKASYSVNPTKADTVADALKAIQIFSGLFSGTTKVNGQVMISEAAQAKFDSEKIEDALLFWTTALKLEQKLGVQFVPGAEFPMEDVRFFGELDMCFNEKKEIVWKHPFDHFRINDFEFTSDDIDNDNIIGKRPYFFEFLEGPMKATLLGTEFEIYSHTKMRDFLITNVQWDDNKKKAGEFYITDAIEKTWTLSRLYLTKDEVQTFKNNVGINET